MKNKGLLLILIIGFSIRVIISFSNEYAINHGISSDDSYYYYRIAQNISNGYGSTFDQINFTNGYQPLVLLFLVLIFSFFDKDLLLPVVISQIIFSLISTIAAYFTFVLVRKLTNKTFPALLSTFLLFLNPVIIAFNFKALETNFYWLFLILTVLFYSKFVHNQNNLSYRFLFGILIAISALSRLDGAFYIVAFVIYLIFSFRMNLLMRIKSVVASGLGFCVLFIPYLVYNFLTFDHVIPISGRAKVFHNHKLVLSQVGDYWTLDFILYELKRFFYPFNFDLFANRGFGLFEQIFAYVIFILLLIGFIYFIKKKYFIRTLNYFKGYGFLILFLFIHYSYYTLYFWEYRFYYYFPEIITLIVLFSISLNEIITDKINSKRIYSIIYNVKFIFAVFTVLFVIGGYKIFTANHEQILPLKTSKWIKQNIPENKILASANAGILSYYSQRKIINLDGMVNNDELLNAYKEGELAFLKYLKEKNIEYIVDYFLSPEPENKYQFPQVLNDKYQVIHIVTDPRLKYQKLNHMLVIKLNL